MLRLEQRRETLLLDDVELRAEPEQGSWLLCILVRERATDLGVLEPRVDQFGDVLAIAISRTVLGRCEAPKQIVAVRCELLRCARHEFGRGPSDKLADRTAGASVLD